MGFLLSDSVVELQLKIFGKVGVLKNSDIELNLVQENYAKGIELILQWMDQTSQ